MDKKPFKNAQTRPNPTKRGLKNTGFIALIVLFAAVLFAANNKAATLTTIPLTQAVSQSNAGDYQQIAINGNQLTITKKNAKTATLKSYDDPNTSLKDPVSYTHL